MTWLIIPLSAILYRLGGSEYGSKWFRWGMGIPIALITHNWLFAITYYIATAIFVYGDNSWVSKLIGRKGARLVHGFAFGLASLNPMFAIWTTIVFYILFEVAEHNMIDNEWAEILRGGFGTIIFVWK